MGINEQIGALLDALRAKGPLVHHISNYVTVNDCANIVLALGGYPVMADAIEESADMVSVSASLVINIGTLNSRTIASMVAAGRKANMLDIPVIIDPVGVGATPFRFDTAMMLLEEIKPAVICGNMSEIKILAGQQVLIKGVDSVADGQGGAAVAAGLAKRFNCVVGITGKVDVVSDGKQVCFIDNGHELLSKVTGAGCMTTSLVGAYCGVGRDYLLAAVAGIMSMGLAGELAYMSLSAQEGLGTFKVRLFDTVFRLSAERIKQNGRIEARLICT